MRSRVLSVALTITLGVVLTLISLSVLRAEAAVLAQSGTGIVRVATTGSDAPGCGGAANPCRTIQYAVDAAQPGEEIRVATGIYTGVQSIPSLNTDILTATQLVAINKSLRVRGGYPDGNWTAPDPTAYPTTLDAEGAGRVVLITGTVTVALEGLRISGGNAAGLGGEAWGVAGGGVWARGAAVTIAGCDIRDNAAYPLTTGWVAGHGGGVYLYECPGAVLTGNTIRGNSGSKMGHGYGGAVYLFNCEGAHLQGNVIQDNTGALANGYGGGVVVSNSSYVVVDANLFQDNMGSNGADYHGGGLYLLRADHAVVTRNGFQGNLSGGGWSLGGGMYLDVSQGVTIARNSFQDNVASDWRGWGGGLVLSNGWDVTVDGNLFRRNKGTSTVAQESWGGGACIFGSGPYTLTNNAFIMNEVTVSGGGLYVVEGSARLLHNTFAANHGGDGTGIAISGTISSVAMTNTIVVDHAVGVSAMEGGSATLDTTLWYSNGQDWLGNVTHSGDRTGQPLFASDGYHLTSASAAVDQAVNSGVSTDIDGQRRPGGAGYDIGADEYMVAVHLPILMRRHLTAP